mgnify:CR=1 FL=1
MVGEVVERKMLIGAVGGAGGAGDAHRGDRGAERGGEELQRQRKGAGRHEREHRAESCTSAEDLADEGGAGGLSLIHI